MGWISGVSTTPFSTVDVIGATARAAWASSPTRPNVFITPDRATRTGAGFGSSRRTPKGQRPAFEIHPDSCTGHCSPGCRRTSEIRKNPT